MRQVQGKGVGVGVGVGSRRERCTSSSMCTYLPDVSPVSPLYLPYISALSAHLVEHVHVGAAQQAAARALRLAALDHLGRARARVRARVRVRGRGRVRRGRGKRGRVRVLPPLITRWSSSQIRSSMTWRCRVRVRARVRRHRGDTGEIPGRHRGDTGEICARLLRVPEHARLVALVALHVSQGDHERAARQLGDAPQVLRGGGEGEGRGRGGIWGGKEGIGEI